MGRDCAIALREKKWHQSNAGKVAGQQRPAATRASRAAKAQQACWPLNLSCCISAICQ